MNKFNAEFKIKIATEAIREEKTLAEIAKIYEVPIYLVTKWHKQLLESAKETFSERFDKASRIFFKSFIGTLSTNLIKINLNLN